jgi:hypothetical protein
VSAEFLESDTHGRRRSIVVPHRGSYDGLSVLHCLFVRLEVPKCNGHLSPLLVGIRNGLPAARVFVPHQEPSPPELDHGVDDLLGNGEFFGLRRYFVEGVLRFDEGSEGHVARVVHDQFARPEDDVAGTGALDHVVVIVLVVPCCCCCCCGGCIYSTIMIMIMIAATASSLVAVGQNVFLEGESQADPLLEIGRLDVPGRRQREEVDGDPVAVDLVLELDGFSQMELEAGSCPANAQRKDAVENSKEGIVRGRAKVNGGHPNRNALEDHLDEAPAAVDRVSEFERLGNVRIRPQHEHDPLLLALDVISGDPHEIEEYLVLHCIAFIIWITFVVSQSRCRCVRLIVWRATGGGEKYGSVN